MESVDTQSDDTQSVDTQSDDTQLVDTQSVDTQSDEIQDTDLKNILTKDVKQDKSNKQKVNYKPSDDMQNLLSLIDNESKNIINKSWPKINRSNKILLLENFVESQIENNDLDEKTGIHLKKLLIKSLNSNLLNKQSDIVYDSLQNTIVEIKSLKYDTKTKTYSLVSDKNNVKMNTKPRSKTNIDKLLNNSKKKR